MALLPWTFEPNAIPALCDFSNLPSYPALEKLKARRQWVAWKYEERNGRMTKPPISPHSGFGASHSKPSSWGTYRQACDHAERKALPGVGYVLSHDDGLTGADLDKVRDPATGRLEEWAREIVDLAETYVEISPSGTGLRLIWRGKIEKTLKSDVCRVEVYAAQRYLTITGWHLDGTPEDILPAPKTWAALQARVTAWKAEHEPEASAPIEGVRLAVAPTSSQAGGSPFYRNVNGAALTSLAAWVPDLFGSSAVVQPGTGAYRVSSKALGRNLEEDLSIAPSGCVDWGVHDMGDGRQGKRTPVDLVMEYGGAPDPRAAAFWLCDRLGREPAHFGWQTDDGRGAELAAGLLARKVVEAPDGTLADAETGEILPPARSGPGDVLDALELGRGVDWSLSGGIIGEIADWIMMSARRPNRPLAVASATAVISAVCGRHLYAPGGTALNLYIVCLANTTVGKGRPFSAVAEILKAAGLGMLQTTAKGFSVSSVEQMVVDHPSCVATIDEIGSNLLGRMSNRNSNTHEQAMRGALLELWSREQGQDGFYTHRRAHAAPVEVPSPSLTIFGASTSEAFYGAVTSGSVRDGFLNRFLLAQAAPRGRTREVPQQARVVPPSIIRGLLKIIPNGTGNLQMALGSFTLNVKPEETRLAWENDAVRDRAAAFEEEILDIMDANPEHASLMGRVFEYSLRLASLHAVSRSGRSAALRMIDLEWGAAWAISSAKAMINGAGSQMAASDYEQKFNAVRNALESAGMLTRQELLRRVRSVSAREREDIIKHLKEGGWIEEVKVPTEGRHAAGWRWIG